ncbi:DUF1707 SHOCT-like domain-containing protein [Nocardioides jensenii]|uniref:DUF1707 SHOCT-like domain-containing protein n=1 Tax=Nocardioides jensenii TaxID=1843 RepID=UPI00082A2F8E|nr:DUF1707 domain-containing protein [Nocardioides jensenii]
MNPAHEGQRAKDSDRTAMVELIDTAYADGQLSPTEREHRTHRALTATTLGELQALTTDLQEVAAPVAAVVRRRRSALVAALVLLLGIGAYAIFGGDDEKPEPPRQDRAAPAVEQDPVEEPVEVADPPVVEKAPLEYSFTRRGVRNFVKIYRKQFGTTEAVAFGFKAGQVNVARRSPDGPQHWQFVDGHFVDAGSYSDGAADGVIDREFPPGSVDLADLDIDAMFDNLAAVERATWRTTFPTRGTSVILIGGRPGVAVAAGDKFTTSCLIWWTTMSGKVLQDNLPCTE